jgi:4-hydroxybenzoate polyprenyltransferase
MKNCLIIMRFKFLFQLVRPHQWYKNLLVFLAIIFSGNLLNLDYLFLSFLGFLVLILISSSSYILNDLIDYENDKINPEKSKRPIASGNVKKYIAISLYIILVIVSLIFSFFLELKFFYCVFGIFLLSTLYSIYLKHILFADILTISSNFVLRAISGALLINVYVSPWLIVGVFFLALFLVSGKRYGEINYLKENATNHRKVLAEYNKEILETLFSIFMTILIIIFALYTFSSVHKNLIYVTPLFVYIVLRYFYLIKTNNKIVRNPESAIFDKPFLISGLLFLIISIIIIMMF